jgi:NADPH-dependent 2,4-dienoyl-CoA reductase/sulfur reductase-like enzyme
MKRIVIVGAGFAGLAAAKALRPSDAEVFVVDRANHNLFQPLLYQVATTVLSPAQIASPIRGLLKNQRNTTVVLGEVGGVNKDAKSGNRPRTPLAFGSMPDGSIDALLQFIDGAGTAALGWCLPASQFWTAV